MSTGAGTGGSSNNNQLVKKDSFIVKSRQPLLSCRMQTLQFLRRVVNNKNKNEDQGLLGEINNNQNGKIEGDNEMGSTGISTLHLLGYSPK